MDSATKVTLDGVEYAPISENLPQGEVLAQETGKDPLERFGGRKFILTVLLLVVFAGFTMVGLMSVADFRDYTLFIAGGYFTANIAGTIVNK